MYTFFTITAKQIGQLQNTSYNTARKEWLRLRQALGLAHGQALMLRHVAQQWRVPVEELAQLLYMPKAKKPTSSPVGE